MRVGVGLGESTAHRVFSDAVERFRIAEAGKSVDEYE